MTPEMFSELMNELKEINLNLKQLLEYSKPTVFSPVLDLTERREVPRRRKTKNAAA